VPLKAIADLVGFPEGDHDRLFHWSNVIVAAEDPDCVEDPKMAMMELIGYPCGRRRP
jgi:cytochrome P450